ncbi:MAG: hypothetical protein HDQ97_14245 [Lachnospiraceae bacterium]|nr:hypothetical protein [Lachnospiraceae bacterium]
MFQVFFHYGIGTVNRGLMPEGVCPPPILHGMKAGNEGICKNGGYLWGMW